MQTTTKKPIVLNSQIIKSFTEKLLISNYDNPKPIPQLHLSMWDLCCLPEDFVGIAAPRKHAKSTAITHAYTHYARVYPVQHAIPGEAVCHYHL
jgi:hypothetical protein